MTAVQRFLVLILSLLVLGPTASANPPVASYIFPAGGQRGTTVKVRVGGLFLYERCGFEMLGPGIEASNTLHRTRTLWFEGPLLPLPDSQQAEDYPQDMAGQVKIAAETSVGIRQWRLWTAQGATPALRMFMVGDLPEIVEDEIEGDPVPVEVKLPITINGRIFPREDVDAWSFFARKGQSITCEVQAARLGSVLDSRLEILDPQGRRIAENDDTHGADSLVRFTAPADGTYQVRIHDIRFQGGQAHVYRLTLTADLYVERVFPLGGRRGDSVKLLLTGQGVPSKPVTVALPADAPQTHACSVTVGKERSNPILLDLDDLPEYVKYPKDEVEQLNLIAVPAVCNGILDRPGESDHWDFKAKKGEVFDIELRAARLGSPLAGVLKVVDATGKELARAESAAATDPSLRFTVPADGLYHVFVAERFRSRGGPAFAYRLRIAGPPATPDFRLLLGADALTFPRGGQGKLLITAAKFGNFNDPISLEIDGLPPGVTAAGTTIGAKQVSTEITFRHDATAPIRVARLTIRGSAKVGDRLVTRTAKMVAVPRGVPEIDSVLLAVAVPTPFKIVGDYDMRWAPRGTVHQRRYRLERNGFEGPIEVRLADRQMRHLQGVTGPTIMVPPGATEFGYAIHLPPWMETGRTCRVCVMGTGMIRDADGSEHAVSFSSTAQNEQVVAVIEPGRLGLEVNPASLTAVPGRSASVTVQLARGKGLDGPAKVEVIVPAHWQGVTAESAVLAAGQTTASLRLKFPDNPAKLPDGPVVLRATIAEKGQPVVAEAKVALRWDR